jgi:hypothetical protein
MTLPSLYRLLPRLPPMLRWIGLALLGILIAAAISVAASRLASQQIGLASEPISAGNALAPPARKQEARDPTSEPAPQQAPEPETAPQPSAPHSIPVTPAHPDDSDGSGGGELSGGGADD